MILERSKQLDFWFSEADEPLRPLVLFLHGSGERGSSPEDVLKWGLPKAVRNSQTPSSFHLVAPQCPKKCQWSDVIDECIDVVALCTERLGDDIRQLAAGFSMGGEGVLEIVASNPTRFEAVIAVAPRNTDYLRNLGYSNFESTKVMIIHGENDPIVPVSESRAIAGAIYEHGGPIDLRILSGKDHYIADDVFELTAFHTLVHRQLRP